MPGYKNADGWIHWLESEEHENLLPEGYFRISDEEFYQIRAALNAPTKKQRIEVIENEVQLFMDSEAQQKGYDNIRSAALRAGYPGPFHNEGVAYAVWMDEVWSACYAILADVEAGNRPEPTTAELLAELPALVLPV